MSLFKVCTFILFYFVGRVAFSFGNQTEQISSQDQVVCLNQMDQKKGALICIASAD